MDKNINVNNLIMDEMKKGQSVKDYMYLTVRKNIIYGKLEPGDIMSEPILADIFHVSRTPVRDAIARLVLDELLEVLPQRGTFISHISPDRVKEGTIMRQLMECEVCRVVCDQITDEQLFNLETNVRSQEFYYKQNKFIEAMELDIELHKLLFDYADMKRIWKAMESISYDPQRVRYLKLRNHFRWDETLKEHWEILQCIKDKDKEKIVNIMSNHIGRLLEDEEIVQQRHPRWFKKSR